MIMNDGTGDPQMRPPCYASKGVCNAMLPGRLGPFSPVERQCTCMNEVSLSDPSGARGIFLFLCVRNGRPLLFSFVCLLSPLLVSGRRRNLMIFLAREHQPRRELVHVLRANSPRASRMHVLFYTTEKVRMLVCCVSCSSLSLQSNLVSTFHRNQRPFGVSSSKPLRWSRTRRHGLC